MENIEDGWHLTKELDTEFRKNENFAIEILEAMAKFLKNDWGITCEEDKKLNDKAVETGDPIIATYETCLGNIFIISEKGHMVNTVLFAKEY